MKNTTGSSNIFTIAPEELRVSAKERLSSKTLELIRQRGIARATGNHQQTSERAKLCREAIKEDLKERRAAVMDEAAEAGKNLRKAQRNFANYKTKMTSLLRPDGTLLHPEGQWRRSSTTSTLISSTATSTCLPAILDKTVTSSLQFSLPKFDMPSRR
uniref:Uncharacterized protein n=1 Tax=Haemonchus contortus TaxID=6289 RepID=W6NFM3_HAECO